MATTTAATTPHPRPTARRKRARPAEHDTCQADKAVPKRRRDVNSEYLWLACRQPRLTSCAGPQLPINSPPSPCAPHDGCMMSTLPKAAPPESILEAAPYTIKEQSVAPVSLLPVGTPSLASGGMSAYIEAASHEVRIRRAAAERDDKGTGIAYARHVRNYSQWWDYQAGCLKENSSWSPISAFPIVAAKAALFLDHEVSRNKVRNSKAPPCLAPWLITPRSTQRNPRVYPRVCNRPLCDSAAHQCVGRLVEEPPPSLQGHTRGPSSLARCPHSHH